MSIPRKIARRAAERGSVLLLVLVVVSLLSALALSSASQTEDLLETQSNKGKAVMGEFAAESAISYARRRLMLDAGWTGTGADPVEFADDTRFSVAATELNPGSGDGIYRVEVSGESHDGRLDLAADVLVLTGVSPYADVAMAFLGDQLKMQNSTIVGDMLITDKANVVDDWVFDSEGNGYYTEGGPYGPFDISFPGTAMTGDLYKYTDAHYGVGGDEIEITARVKMPEYDLDQYLVPGPDRTIYWYENNLQNVSHEETAVFVMHPDHNLSLSNCHFPGGVVVHVDKDYDLRSGDRNRILLKKGTTIGGGSGGVHPNLGLLAPAVEIKYAGNKHKTNGAGGNDDIYGFTFINKIFQVENYQIRGQMIVVNEIKHYNDTALIFDPLVAENPPTGVTWQPPGGDTDLVALWEDYGN